MIRHTVRRYYPFCFKNCGLPNFSTRYFGCTSFTSSGSVSVLDDPEPVFTSTPVKPRKSKYALKKNTPQHFKLLNVNFRSLVNKVGEFKALVETEKPDILVGTETWLAPDIKSSEFLPDGYITYRNDRSGTGKRSGGVLILIRDTIICTHQPQFTTDCEITWIKIDIVGTESLYIGAYYRPHEKDESSVEELRKSLDLVRQNKGTVWLAGDFNFPKMNWINNAPSVHQSCQFKQLYTSFISILDDYNLIQLVTQPTRLDNILDLFLTSNDTLVENCNTIPGISDHSAVCVTAKLKPSMIRTKPRKIYLYKRSNWDLLRSKMEVFKTKFLKEYNGR